MDGATGLVFRLKVVDISLMYKQLISHKFTRIDVISAMVVLAGC
jgi:hypothetical protein